MDVNFMYRQVNKMPWYKQISVMASLLLVLAVYSTYSAFRSLRSRLWK